MRRARREPGRLPLPAPLAFEREDRAMSQPSLPTPDRSPSRVLDGTSGPPAETILLIGHGTRDPDGADEFRGFADDLAARLGGQRSVLPCFLELAPPSILGGIEQCVERAAGRIIA